MLNTMLMFVGMWWLCKLSGWTYWAVVSYLWLYSIL